MTIRVHKDWTGIFHPVPDDDVAWTVNDTTGYMDEGPSCDKCDACECEDEHGRLHIGAECIGLSFAYVCLDGGEALCEECAEKEGLQIIDCDCK